MSLVFYVVIFGCGLGCLCLLMYEEFFEVMIIMFGGQVVLEVVGVLLMLFWMKGEMVDEIVGFLVVV